MELFFISYNVFNTKLESKKRKDKLWKSRERKEKASFPLNCVNAHYCVTSSVH